MSDVCECGHDKAHHVGSEEGPCAAAGCGCEHFRAQADDDDGLVSAVESGSVSIPSGGGDDGSDDDAGAGGGFSGGGGDTGGGGGSGDFGGTDGGGSSDGGGGD